MTERLYYTDSYLTDFDARVVDQSDDGRRVYLDRSALYPTSGGQPHDLGTLNDVPVLDVIDEDDRVAHVLATPLPSKDGSVHGRVDWTRRFDFMQQHTAQHLISAMFDDQFKWPTVSVHFGDESCTLDITAPAFDAQKLAQYERMANAFVVENREVTVTFEDATSAQGLRKPSDRDGELRIVNIAALDRSACGGTHVRRTGEIGAVFFRRSERTKGQVRIEFVCGHRAIARARRDAEALTSVAQMFTAATEEVPRLVELQQQQLKDLERDYKKLQQTLAVFEARAHWENAPVNARGLRVVQITLETGAVKEQETLAQAVTALGSAVVIVRGGSSPGVLFAASADSGLDAGQTLKQAVTAAGGRGGGSPRLAQGSVPSAEALGEVCNALAAAAT